MENMILEDVTTDLQIMYLNLPSHHQYCNWLDAYKYLEKNASVFSFILCVCLVVICIRSSRNKTEPFCY